MVPWCNAASSGVAAPALGGDLRRRHLETPAQKYLLVLAFVCALALIARNLVRGAIGRSWMATRDMDVAAEVIGIRPLRAKLSAFAVSSFLVGVAGALWGFVYLGSWEPLAFDVNRSFQLLFMVIIGGLGSILGSFLGAAFIVVLPLMLNQLPGWLGIPLSTATIAHIESMLFGSLIVFFHSCRHPRARSPVGRPAGKRAPFWPFPH